MNLLDMINTERPHIADNKIETISEKEIALAERFTTSHYYAFGTSVNLHDVAGIVSEAKGVITWYDLLKVGAEANPKIADKEYLEKVIETGHWLEFLKINDKTYIVDNHGLAAAVSLFLFLKERSVLHNVTVNEYITDGALRSGYETLKGIFKNMPVNITVNKRLVKRNDTFGWCRDTYEITLEAENTVSGFKAVLELSDIFECIRESGNPFRRFTGKYKKLWRK